MPKIAITDRGWKTQCTITQFPKLYCLENIANLWYNNIEILYPSNNKKEEC